MKTETLIIKKSDLINEIKDLSKRNKWIHGVLVIHHNKVILDEVFNDYERESCHNLFSVTKSVMSLLIGIAIEKGYINSVENKIVQLLPHYKNTMTDNQKDLKLKDLLTMRTGIIWDELNDFSRNDGLWRRFLSSPDPGAFVLQQPMDTQVNKAYNYNSGVSHLLSIIIEKNCPGSTFDFAQKELFTPLKIDLKKEQWLRDKNNVVYGGHGLHLKMEDVMKLGTLVINNGNFMNKRILSKSWLDESFKTYSEKTRGYEGYGYQWWIGSVKDIPFVGAFGHGGQRLYIFKKMDLAIVFLGNVRPEFGIQERLIRKYIINLSNG